MMRSEMTALSHTRVAESHITGPSYADLRPLKAPTTDTFPVYRDLERHLVDTTELPDQAAAQVLATCAGYAYSDAATVATMMTRVGLEKNHCRMFGTYVDAMLIDSTSFLVQSHNGRVLILAYRGTQPTSLINWLTDLDVDPERIEFPFPRESGRFEVHAGFYRNVRATRYEIVGALARALEGQSILPEGGSMPNPLQALYVTGHSLGGAMAALMAIMLVTEQPYRQIAEKLKGIYTFGQPMVGNPQLAAACNKVESLRTGLIRYVYRQDVVPHLPPKDSGPFEHFGTEYRYHDKWPWEPAPATSQMANLGGLLEAPLAFIARQFRLLRNIPLQYSIDDHLPHHYVSALTPSRVRSEFGD